MARFIPPHPKKGSPEAYAWAERMRAIRKRIRKAGRKTERMFFKKGKLKKFGGMELSVNPGAQWHEQEEQAARKARREAKEIPEKTFYSGVESAHRISAGAARKMGMNPRKTRRIRKNPIAIYGLGNPGNRISAKIEGVIYNRVIEVRAQKTGAWRPGFYRHPFAKRTQVCMLALDNGDILLHSKSGKRLWEAGS